MPAQTQERLDTHAARVTEQLTDNLLAPLNASLSTLEGVFPGIRERMTAIIDPAKLRTALSADVAHSIAAMMKEGTETSLTAALSKVKELRSLIESGASIAQFGAEIAAAKDLMGKNMVGPDARFFLGKDLGEIPTLPAQIMGILNSKCELSNDGRTVAETHRLALVPASVDGKPLTLNALRALATEAGKGRDPSFEGQQWYKYEAFANRPLETSTWVLAYETVAPKSRSKSDARQVALVEKLSNYRTARLLEHVGTMVFNDLENGERIYPSLYGRCEERSASGARVVAGFFYARGLSLDEDDIDGPRRDLLGRAVVRKLDT